MTSCNICYERFLYPMSSEEYENLWDVHIPASCGDRLFDEQFQKFYGLLYGPHYVCSNRNCNITICAYCYDRLRTAPKPSKCVFCRVMDYRSYIRLSVLPELQIKILGVDEYLNIVLNKYRYI